MALPGMTGRLGAQSYGSLGEVVREFARHRPMRLSVGGAHIDLAFAQGSNGIDTPRVVDWVTRSARAVTHYFGRFPVPQVKLLVVADDSAGVGHATTWGYGGATIRIGVGTQAAALAFRRDWVLVHEMVHLALPNLPEEQVWALEGNATYVEPVARVQAGDLDPATIWREMTLGMVKGLPLAGDEGLDRTHSWARTYWGGALYYLVADIDILTRTGGTKGLQHALRAINRASGGNGTEWSMEQLVKTGDAATGVDTLTRLWTQWRDTPVPVDLVRLFADLGVSAGAEGVVFNDDARLASTRRAITRSRA
ncbi:MAG: hypothetical protein DI607_01430 [Sphingomonas hengshuiensis]|nr:MAG: hypothetical protein DI607_01430 [Sphingomonas hengshuiensis]